MLDPPFAVFLVLLLAMADGGPLLAQSARPLSGLSFLGFEPGAPLREVARQTTALGGTALACTRARLDPAVQECRARLHEPASGQSVTLWLSAMDSLTGILTLSAPLPAAALDRWRDALVESYGLVGARAQGTQWMMQWVRQGRMIRLTWRREGKETVVSVSLVDGWVLDGWGCLRPQ